MTDKDKDFINYFRKASAFLDKEQPDLNAEPQKDPQVELAKTRINEYLKLYPGVNPKVIRNLIELKDITRDPTQATPDSAYEGIKSRLGDDETGETLRQERWRKHVHCIKCKSKNVKRLARCSVMIQIVLWKKAHRLCIAGCFAGIYLDVPTHCNISPIN